MSRAEPAYAFPYNATKNQHLHTSVHQYAQQQNQYTTPQDSIIAQTPSTSPQYTSSQNTSIIAPPSLGTQTRRYKAPQHTSIAPPTPNTPSRQYHSNSSIAPLNEHPPSPLTSTQCLPTTNNVPTISSIPSSLPASLPTPTGLSSPNGTTTAATNFDLHEVIAQFGTQPELLKLILTSKVEEDKRKAEEAKWHVKELELMLLERDRQRKSMDHVDESKNDDVHSNHDIDYDNDNSIGPFSTSDGSINYASYSTALSSPVQNLSLNSPSSTPVSQSAPRPKSVSRHNSAPKGQSISQLPFYNQMISGNNQLTHQNSQNQATTENEESNVNGAPNKRKRKRREMLPVTMIIETKVFPYIDDYLWKNNGNTTQRKTGNKSVYFKCSNSNKGCPVNKTVTQQKDGWIIKYRGHHLAECGKIKRIVQS